MEDKLFCSQCGHRIWRNMDGKAVADLYYMDRHFNCDKSLSFLPPRGDRSYTEKKETSSDGNMVGIQGKS